MSKAQHFLADLALSHRANITVDLRDRLCIIASAVVRDPVAHDP
jgi:hypothetical protein